MGYPTKIQLISRQKGNQWYVNFPNALAEAMNFVKGETVEWTVQSITCLHMKRRLRPAATATTTKPPPKRR
jgi:antitoxin component of MazEF toxin-antitoxin module